MIFQVLKLALVTRKLIWIDVSAGASGAWHLDGGRLSCLRLICLASAPQSVVVGGVTGSTKRHYQWRWHIEMFSSS
ncbi:hypothetical protein O3P69_008454 [Scylla paramamosain]|uniref:Secreted protein n=1 Tax=Scylla paramamosain TaxID=85552 RepID=A0AAW0SL81_SCYPA